MVEPGDEIGKLGDNGWGDTGERCVARMLLEDVEERGVDWVLGIARGRRGV